jgi:urea transporter
MKKLLLIGFFLMFCLMGCVSYLAYEHDQIASFLYGFIAVLMAIGFLVLIFFPPNDEK